MEDHASKGAGLVITTSPKVKSGPLQDGTAMYTANRRKGIAVHANDSVVTETAAPAGGLRKRAANIIRRITFRPVPDGPQVDDKDEEESFTDSIKRAAAAPGRKESLMDVGQLAKGAGAEQAVRKLGKVTMPARPPIKPMADAGDISNRPSPHSTSSTLSGSTVLEILVKRAEVEFEFGGPEQRFTCALHLDNAFAETPPMKSFKWDAILQFPLAERKEKLMIM